MTQVCLANDELDAADEHLTAVMDAAKATVTAAAERGEKADNKLALEAMLLGARKRTALAGKLRAELTTLMEYAWTECTVPEALHLYHQAQRMCADAVTLAARSGEVVYGLQARLQAAMLYQSIGLTDANMDAVRPTSISPM
jgi:hypothetical protein